MAMICLQETLKAIEHNESANSFSEKVKTEDILGKSKGIFHIYTMCSKYIMHFGILFIIIILLLSKNNAYEAKTTTNVHHVDTTDPQSDGFWTQKTTWKSRWVKYWRPKAIYVPVWKKVWTPMIVNEYVPLPNPPTAWDNFNESKHETTD